MNEQDDMDSGCHQQQLEEHRHREENSGNMDPRLFTKPLSLPRLTPKEQFDLEMAQIKALNFAFDRIFRG